jgi:hypothetical protein
MRRRIALLSVLGLLTVALGCRHVGGKCDCGAHPADAVIAGPVNPYPAVPAPGTAPAVPPIKPGASSAVPGDLPLANPN